MCCMALWDYFVVTLDENWDKKQKWAEWIGDWGNKSPLGKLLISSASWRHCIATGRVAQSSCKTANRMIDHSGKETDDSYHKRSTCI